ncbi:MAG: hypothetical protein AB1Z98_20865 [Nannocystaceae bacterium]
MATSIAAAVVGCRRNAAVQSTGDSAATDGELEGNGPNTTTGTDDGPTATTGSSEPSRDSGSTGPSVSTGSGSTGPSGSTDAGSTDADTSDDRGDTSEERDTEGEVGDTGAAEGSSTGVEETDGCTFSESFDGVPDGSPWPAPWTAVGGVQLADVQGGRGRVRPVPGPYALARMYAPLSCSDVEGTFTFELTDDATQGAGMYLRHNGGYLQQTVPHGRGLVAFTQAFPLSQGIRAYREVDGIESPLGPTTELTIEPGVVYTVRFRVTQLNAFITQAQARVWPASEIEPAEWHFNHEDGTPALQGVAGGVAIDVWTELEAGVAFDVFVDDIAVMAAP